RSPRSQDAPVTEFGITASVPWLGQGKIRSRSFGRRGPPAAGALLRLRHPLQSLQVDQRLRPPQYLGVVERDEDLLRSAEAADPDGARADAGEDVRIGAGTRREVVLARKA